MNRADRQTGPSSGGAAMNGSAGRMTAASILSSISSEGEELVYTDTESADGGSDLFRVRVFDQGACQPASARQRRMSTVADTPAELSPGGGRELLESPPVLSRRDAADSGYNAHRCLAAASRDSQLPALVAHVSNRPEGTGGTTSWHIPSVLPTGGVTGGACAPAAAARMGGAKR